MEWVIMWTVIGVAANEVMLSVALAYQHADGNLNNKGNGWLVIGLVINSVVLCIIGGGYVNYLTNILPVVHGR